MTDNGIGDYFISDIDDELLEEEDDLIATPVVVPPAVRGAVPPQPAQMSRAVSPSVGIMPSVSEPGHVEAEQPHEIEKPAEQAPVQVTGVPVIDLDDEVPPPAPATEAPVAAPAIGTREQRLVNALDSLMASSPDVQAAALVSMDGFTMASALPTGMQEDRVGAMSAAILGLGERAAAELGRGRLTQVFIEGDDGFVVLIAAGPRAVLTTLSRSESKLGLVLYDMKAAASEIAGILG